MFLSKLTIDFRNRQTRRDLADPYQMHRTLLRAFPDAASGGPGRVLFRVDHHPDSEGPTALVQSNKMPNWTRLPAYLLNAPAQCKPLSLTFHAHQRLCFRLRANPTVKREGRRLALLTEDLQRAWLIRKSEISGFRLGLFHAAPEGFMAGHKDDHHLTHFAVRFDGVLEVTDPELFRQTVHAGIGSAKGFGFGLLSVAPARE